MSQSGNGSRKFLLIGMPCWGVEYPFHPLAHVGAIIQNEGWECVIADLNVRIFRMSEPEDRKFWNDENVPLWADPQAVAGLYEKYRVRIEGVLEDLLAEGPFDLAGFTVNGFTKHFSIEAARFIKSIESGLPVLFGGVECFPAEFGARFLTEREKVPDAILQGEAEIALPLFLKEFKEKKSIRTAVPGFAYRDADGIVNNGEPDLPRLKDLDLVADYSQFDFSQYLKPGGFPTFFTRGCVKRCEFCSEGPNFRRFRSRKPETVLEEIQEGLKYVSAYSDRPTVHFSDSIFNGNIRELDRLCDLILESGIEIEWGGQAVFHKDMTRPFLEKLRRAGCVGIFWGLESGSQRMVDLMKKNYDLEVAERIIVEAKEAGINSSLPTIVGFPGETAADFLATLHFTLRRQDQAFFTDASMCLIRPNSPLHDRYRDFGVKDNVAFDWITDDGANHVGIRRFRRYFLLNAIRRTLDSLEGSVDRDSLHEVDFNDLFVAAEAAEIAFKLGKTGGLEREAETLLRKWKGAPVREIAKRKWLAPRKEREYDRLRPACLPRRLSLDDWFCRDKNSAPAREKIVNFLFKAIRENKRLAV